MADKERIDRPPVLGIDRRAAFIHELDPTQRLGKAETELERLREGVKALVDEWGRRFPATGGHYANRLRALLDEVGGA